MAAKSFEEQVREELEAVRLQPDGRVWENVSAALARRRRCFGIFWLLPALIIAGIIWGVMGSKKPTSTPSLATHQQTGPGNKKATDPSLQSREKIQTDSRKHYEAPEMPGSRKSSMLTISPVISGSQQALRGSNQAKPGQQLKQGMGNADPFSMGGITTAGNRKEAAAQTIIDTTAKDMVSEKQDMQTSDKQKTVEPTLSPKDSAEQPVSPGTVHVAKIKRPWQWQASATAGISGAGKPGAGDPLSYSYPNSAQYNPGSGNSIAGVTYRIPTEKSSMYISAEVHAIKQLNKQWGLGFHAGYALYANTIGVGRRYKDSSGFVNYLSTAAKSDNGYVYLSTDSTAYTNRYHYLSMGVNMYRNISLGKAMQLRWNLGAAAGILLSSNALYFDEKAGLLYHNSSLLSKVQFSISSGIDLGFGKKPLIYAGPQFGYALSRTSGTSAGRHLWYFGLRISAVLPEKRSGMQR